MRRWLVLGCLAIACTPKAIPPAETKKHAPGELLTGEDAKGDWTTDAPGMRRQITVADLPPPNATDSVDNGAKMITRPAGAMPLVPAGWQVSLFAEGLENPRMLRTAPNGDIFVVESENGQVRVLRDADHDGKPEVNEIFVGGLKKPFGIAFRANFVYVANTDSVVRFPYTAGATKAGGPAETIVNDISGGGKLRGGGHWTRDVVFSNDGTKMYVSVGSKSNVSDNEEEARRARIFEFDVDGKNERVFATGIRNPVGLAVNPDTGALWTSVNERDELGDHLVPDYVTHVTDGGFYGWPWFYLGNHQDPRHKGKHPELADKVIVPDVLLQSHSASLGMTFYKGDAYAAEHGSWNRARRTGYKLIRIPMKDGKAIGEYVDFMTGFVTPSGDVWGRPVAVTVASDDSLLVSDDGGNCVWRLANTVKAPPSPPADK